MPALFEFPHVVDDSLPPAAETTDQAAPASVEMPAESAPAVQSRQLSFLDLRAELARRGAKLPKARTRKPVPGQGSLFDLTQREAS
ncbi:MAG: hypothetical protein ACR2JY_02925 [Chloroflexota bacterium]